MKVLRIVANIAAEDITAANIFYGEILGLAELMNHGWIVTYGSTARMNIQLSIASEGGSGTPVPDLSIEVDDVDGVYERMKSHRFPITYDITDEPWGVRRFFVKDPFGKLVNILMHL